MRWIKLGDTYVNLDLVSDVELCIGGKVQLTMMTTEAAEGASRVLIFGRTNARVLLETLDAWTGGPSSPASPSPEERAPWQNFDPPAGDLSGDDADDHN